MSLHATLSIDVMKIDKPALFKGKKGTYLGLVLMDNKDGGKDKYGNDGFVAQDIGKDRRLKGEKGPIVGNWKRMEQRAAAPTTPERKPSDDLDLSDDDKGEMPF